MSNEILKSLRSKGNNSRFGTLIMCGKHNIAYTTSCPECTGSQEPIGMDLSFGEDLADRIRKLNGWGNKI